MTFTRKSAQQTKGYWARDAERLFIRYPLIHTVLVEDISLTALTRRTGYVHAYTYEATMIFVRPSSSGKWGRSRQEYGLMTADEYAVQRVFAKLTGAA